MINKVKLNAAEVIKHMKEKELKKYKITLEQEGKSSSISAPTWFKEFYAEYKQFYVEFKTFVNKQEQFNASMLDFKSKQEQFNASMLEFKDYVLDQFKKHGWTK